MAILADRLQTGAATLRCLALGPPIELGLVGFVPCSLITLLCSLHVGLEHGVSGNRLGAYAGLALLRHLADERFGHGRSSLTLSDSDGLGVRLCVARRLIGKLPGKLVNIELGQASAIDVKGGRRSPITGSGPTVRIRSGGSSVKSGAGNSCCSWQSILAN